MSVQNLLSNVHQRLEWMRESREVYEPQFAPRFNVISLFERKEINLSRILSDLLDPKGTHGQRDAFLRLFLARIKLNEVFGDTRFARVTREFLIINEQGRNRSIDIVIENQETILAIENKPWAGESEDQVKDYWIAIEGRAKVASPFLLFLSGERREVTSMPKCQRDDLIKRGKLKEKAYADLLVPWLDDCVRECRAERVRHLVLELKNYILTEFSGEPDMTETNAIVDLALKSEESLRSALDIGKSISDLKNSLNSDLNRELRNRAQNAGFLMEGSFPTSGKGQVTFGKVGSSWNSKNIAVFFDSFGSWIQGGNFGIVARDTTEHPMFYTLNKSLERMLGPGVKWADKCGDYYVWASKPKFLRPYGDWRLDNAPWVAIMNGSMAHDIFEEVEAAIGALEAIAHEFEQP